MIKAIKCCGECANYNWQKHKCMIAHDEGKPKDHFYTDCPLPNVPEWTSIKDKPPEIGTDFIAHYADGYIGTDTRFSFGYVFDAMRGGITHWMPLPEPPEEKK